MNLLHGVVAVLAGTYFLSEDRREKQKLQYAVMCALLLLLSCFRSVTVGIDTKVYANYFLMFRRMTWAESLKWGFEPGYIALNKLIGLCTDNVQVFLAVLSIIILIPVFILTWKKSENPVLSLFIFVVMGNWYNSFAILRQWCAIAILTFAYDYIIKRRFAPFLLLTMLACLFHQTALFMLPLYCLYPVKITWKKLLLCVWATVVIYLFPDEIMDILNHFARLETATRGGTGYTLLMVLWVLIFVVALVAAPIVNEPIMKLNYMALLYSAIIQPLSLSYSGFARIHQYCWFSTGMVIPCFIQYISRKYDRQNRYIMKLLVIAVLAIWYLVTLENKVLTLA